MQQRRSQIVSLLHGQEEVFLTENAGSRRVEEEGADAKQRWGTQMSTVTVN